MKTSPKNSPKLSRWPLSVLFFSHFLLLTGLACNAFVVDDNGSPAAADTDEVVRQAVATIQAELPERIAVEQAAGTEGATVSSDLEARLIELETPEA